MSHSDNIFPFMLLRYQIRTPCIAPANVHYQPQLLESSTVDMHYQLAFFTPGRLPSRAFSRKQNYLLVRLGVGYGKHADVSTLAILKSLKTPRDLPPSIQRLLICVDLV